MQNKGDTLQSPACLPTIRKYFPQQGKRIPSQTANSEGTDTLGRMGGREGKRKGEMRSWTIREWIRLCRQYYSEETLLFKASPGERPKL